MSTKSLKPNHPIFAIAANMSAKFIGSLSHTRTDLNISVFRGAIINFIFDEEGDLKEDE